MTRKPIPFCNDIFGHDETPPYTLRRWAIVAAHQILDGIPTDRVLIVPGCIDQIDHNRLAKGSCVPLHQAFMTAPGWLMSHPTFAQMRLVYLAGSQHRGLAGIGAAFVSAWSGNSQAAFTDACELLFGTDERAQRLDPHTNMHGRLSNEDKDLVLWRLKYAYDNLCDGRPPEPMDAAD